MGFYDSFMSCHRICSLSSFVFFFLILSSNQLRFQAEAGRANPKSSAAFSQMAGEEENNKAMLRGEIGSRPPRCERRCSTCGHCEAIQVPTNPQIKKAKTNSSSSSSTNVSTVAHARERGDEDYNSNYKPMSWKCKCGKFIFNP